MAKTTAKKEELEDDASPFNTLLRWDAATKNRLSVNLVHG